MYLVYFSSFEALKPDTNVVEGCSGMDNRHEQGWVERFRGWDDRVTAQRREIQGKECVERF